MYQLFAYGKKYQAKKLVLIYPKHKDFSKSFSFKFEEDLELCVLPFDLDDLENLSIFRKLL